MVAQPIRRFLDIEASGGLLLAAATVVALVWANSPARSGYTTFWHTHVMVGVGHWAVSANFLEVVNDALMAVFFFVIGLEIKREWVLGELRDRRAALLPIAAALGGMAVPAVLFLAVSGATPGGHGWGIPMATDIAFVIGVMALLGTKVPTPLKVFLLTLAIVDDLGAIVVIAVFYAGSLDWAWLATAVVGLGFIAVLRKIRVRWMPVYVVFGVVVWFATWQSGVHPTIAGVALAFLTPAVAFQPSEVSETIIDTLESRDDLTADDVRSVAVLISEAVSPLDRLQHGLHPWSSYVVVPVFALANAGVPLTTDIHGDGLRVALGVVVGLVVGKFVGVWGASWLVIRMGWASRPSGVSWMQLAGGAALAGIGFTMSLFVTDLAFASTGEAEALVSSAKLGVLAASVVAGLFGTVLLGFASRRKNQVQDS